MSLHRCRRDTNEKAVIAALEAAGCMVACLSGKGVPDLLVMRRRQLWLVEVKDGAKPPSERRLTPDQQAWHARWQDANILVFTSVNDALTWIGAFST